MVKEEGAKFYEENKDIVNMYNSVIPLAGWDHKMLQILSHFCVRPKLALSMDSRL